MGRGWDGLSVCPIINFVVAQAAGSDTDLKWLVLTYSEYWYYHFGATHLVILVCLPASG